MNITMCTSDRCSKANTCLRMTGTPSEYCQSYADFADCCTNNDCEYYLRKISEHNVTSEEISDILIRC